MAASGKSVAGMQNRRMNVSSLSQPPVPTPAKSREEQFWRWQFLGWLIYGVAMFIAAVQELPPTEALVNKSVNTLIGFGLSCSLRALYLRALGSGHKESAVLAMLVACCVAGGLLWSALANFAFWSYMGFDLSAVKPANLFAWSLTHMFALLAWVAMFVGAQYAQRLRDVVTTGLPTTRERSEPDALVFRSDGELTRLQQSQIVSIEAARNYSCIVSDLGTHVVRMPLATVERKLSPDRFLRVHRSAIIAIDRVKSLRVLPAQDAIATLLDGREIKVSRAYKPLVESALSRR